MIAGERWALWRRRSVVVALGVMLSACGAPPPRAPEGRPEPPSGFPVDFYQGVAPARGPVFEVDAAQSLLVIEVHRGGTLARLGHDHAIASHAVHGYVAPNESRGDLYLRLDELVVDEPALRAAAGFDTQPNDAAIEGTRANMLALLHAEAYPYALIAVEQVDAAGATASLTVSITVNGAARQLRIPAQIEQRAGRLQVRGQVALEQSEFGVVPASLLGGAIQVQDRVDVRFVIQAHRL